MLAGLTVFLHFKVNLVLYDVPISTQQFTDSSVDGFTAINRQNNSIKGETWEHIMATVSSLQGWVRYGSFPNVISASTTQTAELPLNELNLS